jgi:hypothetical protein
MTFIRYLRTPKCPTGKFSTPSFKFHRMASFYNVDVAGLTNEQAEVCGMVCGEKVRR